MVIGRCKPLFIILLLLSWGWPVFSQAAPEPLVDTCSDVRNHFGVDLCWGPSRAWLCALPGTEDVCAQAMKLTPTCCMAAATPSKTLPSRDWDGRCPPETTLCEPSSVSPPSSQPAPRDGAPRTCCNGQQHCEEYAGSVYCAPNSEAACVKPDSYCGPTPPNTTEDSTCCPEDLKCDRFSFPFASTIYYCSQRGGTNGGCSPESSPCGDNRCCRNATESCYLIGAGKGMCGALCVPNPGSGGSDTHCTPKCSEGQTVCEGWPNGHQVFICCPQGTCSSSNQGAPLCVPGSSPTRKAASDRGMAWD